MKRPISSGALRHHSAAARTNNTRSGSSAWYRVAFTGPSRHREKEKATPPPRRALTSRRMKRAVEHLRAATRRRCRQEMTRLTSNTFQSHASRDLSLRGAFDAVYIDAKVNKTLRDETAGYSNVRVELKASPARQSFSRPPHGALFT